MSSSQPTPFIDELRNAARGFVALLTGNRSAPDYFDFSQRGIVGSFIALLTAVGAELAIAGFVQGGSVFASLLANALFYAAVLGSSTLYLRQINRLDALAGFVVSVNWSNALFSLVAMLAQLLGLDLLNIVLLLAALFVTINICRLIMKISVLQIVVLLIAQFAGLVLATLIMLMIFPLSPEQVAAITSQAG